MRSAIGEIFASAHGRLLVVGLPGAGKTTLLLQLALYLLEHAEARVAHLEGVPHVMPLPVLLNPATWRSEFVTFDEWLRRIRPPELGASTALAEKIRRETPLILLLDGLDEVPEADRASCLESLAQYGIGSDNQYVISSRINEYASAKDAPVYAEIEVAPLTTAQVEKGLTDNAFKEPGAQPLLTACKKDPVLLKALDNPFHLNTALLLFAPGRKWSDFGFTAADVAGRQRELVERFVEDALGRKVKREYGAEKAGKWLGFLAWKMEESDKVTFDLIDVHIGWSNRKLFLRSLIILLDGLLFGFIIGMLVYTFEGTTLGVMSALYACLIMITWIISMRLSISSLLGLVYLLVYVILKNKEILSIKTVKKNWHLGLLIGKWANFEINEKQGWRWKNFIKNWKQAFGRGMLLGILTIPMMSLLTAIFYLIANIDIMTPIIIVSSIALSLSLIHSFIDIGLSNNYFIQPTYPYQRLLATSKNFNFSLLNHLILRFAFFLESSLPPSPLPKRNVPPPPPRIRRRCGHRDGRRYMALAAPDLAGVFCEKG